MTSKFDRPHDREITIDNANYKWVAIATFTRFTTTDLIAHLEQHLGYCLDRRKILSIDFESRRETRVGDFDKKIEVYDLNLGDLPHRKIRYYIYITVQFVRSPFKNPLFVELRLWLTEEKPYPQATPRVISSKRITEHDPWERFDYSHLSCEDKWEIKKATSRRLLSLFNEDLFLKNYFTIGDISSFEKRVEKKLDRAIKKMRTFNLTGVIL